MTTETITSPAPVFLDGPTHPNGRYKKYPRKVIVATGLTQIVVGLLCIVLGISGIVVRALGYFVGVPIWTGAVFLVAGILGIRAGQQKTGCLIIGHMVMSIIAAVFTVIVLGSAASGLANEHYHSNIHDYMTGCYEQYDSACKCYRIPPEKQLECDRLVKGRLSIHGILVILAILEAIIAILAASLSCRAVCTCCTNQPQPTVVYQVAPNGHQVPGQVHFLPAGQPITMVTISPSQSVAATAPSQPMVVPTAPANQSGVVGASAPAVVGLSTGQQPSVVVYPVASGQGYIQPMAASAPTPVPATNVPPQPASKTASAPPSKSAKRKVKETEPEDQGSPSPERSPPPSYSEQPTDFTNAGYHEDDDAPLIS
ncbi:MS4A4A [Branchiostoma lanceolatum]|uniref:MS4A4A protein n=1 Tax=Branchiostoma lanceolatum TaxID=7740 RepID=A0A8J9ZJ07_BRALA|nr:MS4A4A [Branchiostoma lanceolatum]